MTNKLLRKTAWVITAKLALQYVIAGECWRVASTGKVGLGPGWGAKVPVLEACSMN